MKTSVKDSERKTMSESEVNERQTFTYLLVTMNTDSLSREEITHIYTFKSTHQNFAKFLNALR
jgi:hypothetical protein